MDEQYKRIQYCRYVDDFLNEVIGSKEYAISIRDAVRLFLKDTLHLELSLEKTLITNSLDKAKFLGYEITVSKRSKHFTRRANGQYRFEDGVIKLYVLKEKWMMRLLDKGNMIILNDADNHDRWKPVARSSFVNRAPVEIIGFNSEIRGMHNYYALADKLSVLNKYYYIMQYSMYGTFAAKYGCSQKKIIEKHKKNDIFGIDYFTPRGNIKHIDFYHGGFKKKSPPQLTLRSILFRNLSRYIIQAIRTGYLYALCKIRTVQ